jgi:L-fuconolactonase
LPHPLQKFGRGLAILRGMKVDSHQHFWRYHPERDGWITAEMQAIRRDFLPQQLAPELSRNGIDASVAVQAGQSEHETHFLLDLADRHAFIAGVVGWVDLRAPNLASRLEYFSQFETLRGFRHVAQAEADDFLARPDVVKGVGELKQFRFTYDILVYPRQLPAAIQLVEKHPEQAFVLDHLAKPSIKSRDIAGWAANIRALARHPRVFCKLSGLITEADWSAWRAEQFKPYLDVVYEEFGPDRLMFGSDWPVCLVAGSYAQVKDLISGYLQNRPHAETAKIFGWNAVRFYGLKAAQAAES